MVQRSRQPCSSLRSAFAPFSYSTSPSPSKLATFEVCRICPQIARSDMMGVVAQRPDLRRMVRLMYPGASAAAASAAAGAGQPKPSKAEREARRAQEDEVAIAEWRAAAARPIAQEGRSWGAAAAVAAAVVQVTKAADSFPLNRKFSMLVVAKLC